MSQETIEQRFEVGSPAKLKLSNIRGSIDIRAGEDKIIAVTAVKYLKTGNTDQTEIKIEQADDGLVSVKTDYQNSGSNWFGVNKPCKVDYTVQVPKNCDVTAKGVSCEVSVRGLTGAIDISSVSGELTLAELSGFLKISAVSGSISAEKLTGELEANAVSGKLRIMDSQLSKASIKTVSGSMVIQTPLSEGPYHFKGVSGSATLIVPADTACSANFRSVSGRMRTSMPVTKDQRYGSRGSMEIQGGGPEVSYNCVSGAFKIVTAENQEITEHKAPVESESSPKNQMDVLQKIERGEISVEDALKELNA
jgi:hypothetical protein